VYNFGEKLMTNYDYYQSLQVEPNATSDDIREAFYALAQKRHAQRGKDIENAVQIQQVAEAYNVLGNPLRRARYDQERLQESSHYDSENLTNRSKKRGGATSKKVRWFLVAGIFLLGAVILMSALAQGIYWLPVLMIVALCVAMNLLAMFLTKNADHEDLPNESSDSSRFSK
jgi:curved DNA-binding protein CbpA